VQGSGFRGDAAGARANHLVLSPSQTLALTVAVPRNQADIAFLVGTMGAARVAPS